MSNAGKMVFTTILFLIVTGMLITIAAALPSIPSPPPAPPIPYNPPAPPVAPTYAPDITSAPSSIPTLAPNTPTSSNPTAAPTIVPTNPTDTSDIPILTPNDPAYQPTGNPTVNPTVNPTNPSGGEGGGSGSSSPEGPSGAGGTIPEIPTGPPEPPSFPAVPTAAPTIPETPVTATITPLPTQAPAGTPTSGYHAPMPAAGGGFGAMEVTGEATQAMVETQAAFAVPSAEEPLYQEPALQSSGQGHQQAPLEEPQSASQKNPSGETTGPGENSGEIIDGFHSAAVGQVLPALAGVIPPQAAPVVAATIAVGAGFIAAVGTAIAPSAFTGAWFSKVYMYIRNFIGNYLLGKMGVKEAQLRKIAPVSRETHFMRMHIVEISATIVGAAIYAISFMIAKKAGITPDIFILYLATAGVAITVHEVGHRYIAHHYRDAVEIKLWDVGIITMFITALLTGVVFAKPTRNMISNAATLEKGEMGRIMLAGPGLSLIIAAISVPFLFLGGVYTQVATLSIMFNLLIGTYHMMPFPPMDGKAVLGWNRYLWLLTFVPLMVMYFYMFLI